MTTCDFQFWTLIATWLAAIGTVSAVIVSLYVLISNRKISISITSDIYQFEGGKECLIIKVTNTGLRSVVINNCHCIYFQIGRFKSKKFIAIGTNYIDQRNSSSFPCQLTEGEVLNLVISLENEDGNWLQNFKSEYLKGVPLSTLKVVVCPNVSKSIKTAVGNSIIKKLRSY